MSHAITIKLPDSLMTTGGYPLPFLARVAVQFAVIVTKWDMNYRTRKQLARLDEHMLRDIGIERDAACTEARRPFWH
ncbi:DUF1127 domain-containing protein [Roseovarius aestuarii]|uniref:YjiS-like domain-containing protein n=1 Tax=Roseovarius aestuarii TaxID=475083 RepID=A0A1X7BNI1_9RHOB|nr:DUF1127 domain-containing protein [Roseovarius aestuarii]SMC11176.1 hypothetical protein ROA7745_00987 [Roseovarius aestuarii]